MIKLIVWHDGGCLPCGRETVLLQPFGLAARWSGLRAQLERLYPLFLRFRPQLPAGSRRGARNVKPRSDPVGPGQRSVWDFPRPAIAERCFAPIMVEHAGHIIADTRSSIHTLETSHPPSYYIPPDSIAPGVLRGARGAAFCEWKGAALYWDVVVGDLVLPRVGWSYPTPHRHLRCYATTSPSTLLRSIARLTAKRWSRSPALSTGAGSPPTSPGRSRASPEALAGERRFHRATPARSSQRARIALRPIRTTRRRGRRGHARRGCQATGSGRAVTSERPAPYPRQYRPARRSSVAFARGGNEAWPDDLDGCRQFPSARADTGHGGAARQCPPYAAAAADDTPLRWTRV